MCCEERKADMPSTMRKERGRSQKSRSRSASSKSSSSSKSSRSRSSSRSRAGSAKSSRSRSRSSSKSNSSRSPSRFVSRSRSRSSSRSKSRSRSKSVSKSPAQTPRSSSPVQTPCSTSPVQTPRSSSSESRDRSQSAERTRLPSPPTEAPRGLLRQVTKKHVSEPSPVTVLFIFRQQYHQSPQIVPRKTMQTMPQNQKCLQRQGLNPLKRQSPNLLLNHHLVQPPAPQRVLQAGFIQER